MRGDLTIKFSKIKDLTFKITMGYDDHRFKHSDSISSQEKIDPQKKEVI